MYIGFVALAITLNKAEGWMSRVGFHEILLQGDHVMNVLFLCYLLHCMLTIPLINCFDIALLTCRLVFFFCFTHFSFLKQEAGVHHTGKQLLMEVLTVQRISSLVPRASFI